MNSNGASLRPHETCARCRERRQFAGGNPDPRVWVCSDRHLASALGQPLTVAEQPTFLDGGRPHGAIGERLREAERAQAAQNVQQEDIVIRCAGAPACSSLVTFVAGTTPDAIERHLVAHGWMGGWRVQWVAGPVPGARQTLRNGQVAWFVEIAAAKHCSKWCQGENRLRAVEPAASPEPIDDDARLIAALYADSLGAPAPVNARGREEWERRQAVIRRVVSHRTTIRDYGIRIGRQALLRELRGVAPETEDRPDSEAAPSRPVQPLTAAARPPEPTAAPTGSAVDSLGRRHPSATTFRPR